MHQLITDGDFKAGFEAGFRAIRGKVAALPAYPAAPATKANMTPYLMGVRKGIERATGKSIDEITG